uniref:Uncharacterized protein n=1 Tax=Anguilla anguilla TaxID=7936 RepID=A0A0E9UXI4_ANGAN
MSQNAHVYFILFVKYVHYFHIICAFILLYVESATINI